MERVNNTLNRVLRRESQDESHFMSLSSRITYKFSRLSMYTTFKGVEDVTKHMFIIDGVATDVVQRKTGYTWNGMFRVTLDQIIKDMVKSLKS